ncbi:MAG: hypothetical protein A2X37_05045 [Elusimicrobia bacterium GWA2_66_18]|nr:MAG: hypothetical protein A2X37_05045 [Elusimicrobia bacterium GWA2_66_18]
MPAIIRQLCGRRHTLCAVDGGSTDGTVEFLRGLAQAGESIIVIERPRPGRGCQRGDASRAGLAWLLDHTDHEIFVDIDGDDSQPPEELASGIAILESPGCDVVIASKYVRGAAVTGRPVGRRLVSLFYNALVRALAGTGLRDHSNTYRFYTRRAARLAMQIDAQHTGPLFMLEMLLHWVCQGLSIVEVPTRYRPRIGGESKVALGDFALGLWGALRLARRARLRGSSMAGRS